MSTPRHLIFSHKNLIFALRYRIHMPTFIAYSIIAKTLPVLRGGYNRLLINSLHNNGRDLREKCRRFSCALASSRI